MAGTKAGGIKTRETILARDPDHYRKVGALGGKKTYESGKLALVSFASDPERARRAGAKGGYISRRGKKHETA